MRLVSVWSDLYGSTLGLYTGRAGGHRWLVAATPEQAQAAANALAQLDGKGETLLLVYAGTTPLHAALRHQQDAAQGRGLAGAVVIGPNLTDGPEVSVPDAEQPTTGDGLSYHEGGTYPAWADALGRSGRPGECMAASVCAALGLPVRVCPPERLQETLLEWWSATPHALTAG